MRSLIRRRCFGDRIWTFTRNVEEDLAVHAKLILLF